MKLTVLDGQPARCTGGCCRNFLLTTDLDANAVDVLRLLRGEVPVVPEYIASDTGKPAMRLFTEGEEIAAMVLPLYGPYHKDASAQARFTCRHFDGANCTNYENRPELCRDHGLYSACGQEGCTFDQRSGILRGFREHWSDREKVGDRDDLHWRKWLRATLEWLREDEPRPRPRRRKVRNLLRKSLQ